ncbi:uncharacterized protein isoform X2 [Leptinotarsa decemlineata]|uniref:uncharacterized protein isoform X2 n=1 Tax=Leptinotarsa decemlineata TaxID=7539 RepID=UPI000C253DE7|nr:U2 small nuclear ribonucleoprotein auxiliary factor 35 kDa subunit-related protein 2 isoform X2 [Leptinotarsa decemlineata]
MGKHSEWRKLAKKARRKRIRQQNARLRDQKEIEELKKWESTTEYKIYLAERARAEELKIEQEAKEAKEREVQWLIAEAQAQLQFKELQEKLSLARVERARQNELIKQEWEKDQKKQKELKALQEKELEEKLKEQKLLNEKVDNFIENGGDTPDHLKTILETNPNKSTCPFFQKTSTCRFYDCCSRNHVRPGISRIIQIPNFFSHYSLEKTENDNFSDSSLEFESHETFEHYREFFHDVVSEVENYGKIKLFITCCNHETHLRGNVFIEFSSTRSALKCYRGLNGRWYGGKQLSVQFSTIPSWKSAICGLYNFKRCPKGNSCNFLHIFRNPRNLYSSIEETRNQRPKNRDDQSDPRNWRWSESPERFPFSERSEWDNDTEYEDHQRKPKSHTSHRSRRRRSRSNDKNSSSSRSISSRYSNGRHRERSSRSRTPERKRKKTRTRSRSRSSRSSKIHTNSDISSVH